MYQCQYEMLYVLISTALALLLGLAATQSFGQISPVRLKVNKVIKKERAEREEGGKPLIQQVLYEVELSNASTAAANDLTIKWAILYKPNSYSSEVKILEGDRTCSLSVGQKYKFETDPLEVPLKKRGYYGSSSSGTDILGYFVEVYSGKKILTSDIQPADTKARVLKAKEAEEKRHRDFSKPNPPPHPKPADPEKN